MESLSPSESRLIAKDRLRWLSIGYFVSGAVGVVMVSFLLIHFTIFAVISFIPEHAFNPQKSCEDITQRVNPAVPVSTVSKQNSEEFPRIIFRIIAGVLGVIILIGWTLGGLTIYAGVCIRKRKHLLFIQIMAGFNCLGIPYGTLLGIGTFILFGLPEVKEEFQQTALLSRQ
ncbi:MAG: hypothetical protein ABI254_11220 [Chthoniobacterales bacterium]